MRPGAQIIPAPRHDARQAVRELLCQSPDYAALDDPTRRAIAGSLARISSTALDMHEAARPPRPPLALAQNAGSEFSGIAVDRVAGTTQNMLNAVSFPRFVNELITGVFKAMNDSNQQQLTAFVDLIRNVAQTTEGFADSNVGVSGARSWLAEHFPGSYMIEGGDEVDMAAELEGLEPGEAQARRAEIQAEQDEATRIVLRPGATPPTEAALRSALGAPEGSSLPGSNPETLVPLARQVLARNRQQLLATMVQMGLQRIVIESGRVNASMRLHVDANSAAANDRGSQFDMRNTTEAGVGAKFGPWGVEAKIQNTIGYVSTDRTQTTEGINASVDLDSGVELVFKTDYVPLNRLAGGNDVERIRANTLNPAAEAARLTSEANSRSAAATANLAERATRLDAALHTPAALPAATIDTSRLASGATSARPPPNPPPAGAVTPPPNPPPAGTVTPPPNPPPAGTVTPPPNPPPAGTVTPPPNSPPAGAVTPPPNPPPAGTVTPPPVAAPPGASPPGTEPSAGDVIRSIVAPAVAPAAAAITRLLTPAR